MNEPDYNPYSYEARLRKKISAVRWQHLHLDSVLLLSLITLIVTGLFILYSASNRNIHMVVSQSIRFFLGFIILFIFAQISPRKYYQWAPYLFIFIIVLLLGVLLIGHMTKGAQRWINMGLFEFQPSEIMKIITPLILARYLHDQALPPDAKTIAVTCLLIFIPVVLTLLQPDLGTAIIIALSGFSVLFLAGLNWRIIAGLFGAGILSMPILWHLMKAYQKARMLTFFNPERDPLGAGYHIIQSKIAIGSGGLFGKGWLMGTQSHLQFLPEHATDFIFAVNGEELGLIGCAFLLLLFSIIFARALYISTQAADTFSRLFAGSIALIFFISFFINIGMVIGILPVVGTPLPLISYGGTSIITLMMSFGMLMSIYTHRNFYKH